MSPSRRRWCAMLVGLGLDLGLRQPTLATSADSFASNFSGMRLTDQDGRAFSFDRLAGKVLLVNFVFTGCSTICPVQTRALAEVQASLPQATRNGVHFVSLSLDPLSDTPDVLKSYGQRIGIDFQRWSFVTGPPTEIEHLTDRLRLLRVDLRSGKPTDHATSLWLVDARGRLMQRLSGNPPDGRRLREEIVSLRSL